MDRLRFGILILVCGILPSSIYALAPLEPAEGVWFGVSTDNSMTQDASAALYGFQPVTFGTFIQIPVTFNDISNLGRFLDQVGARMGIAMITLQPEQGLELVTWESMWQLAGILQLYASKGCVYMIRFAHEMNGAWYPWSQMPTLYIEKFRLVSKVLHEALVDVAMVWAPNHGAGYPFWGGAYICENATVCDDFDILDTNGDGVLNVFDDMYAPYYPGDDVVDWVGMTLYHWGRTSPWWNNYVAEPTAFYGRLTGTFDSWFSNETMLPDFYHEYCEDGVHNKPLVIPETAALFNTNASCCKDELTIKKSWWSQVFNVRGSRNGTMVDVSEMLPRIKMINWFDVRKEEQELEWQVCDWSFSTNETVRESFVDFLRLPSSRNGRQYWHFLEEFHASRAELASTRARARGSRSSLQGLVGSLSGGLPA